MKYLIILQARMNSTRLPGKVLMEVGGKPLLAYQIERLRRCTRTHHIILATTDQPADDSLVEFAERQQIECFRGSENDVLDRYYQAAKLHRPDGVVRVTGDCPLIDPAIIDESIRLNIETNADYTSNVLGTKFPDGLDVEVVRWSALASAWARAELTSEREHVTPFIWKRALERVEFSYSNLDSPADFGHLRWTVDDPQDFELLGKVIAQLYPENPIFSWFDVLALLTEQPALLGINSATVRNSGYLKSVAEDAKKGKEKQYGPL